MVMPGMVDTTRGALVPGVVDVEAPLLPRPEKASRRSSSSFVSLTEDVQASIVKRRRTFSPPMSCQMMK